MRTWHEISCGSNAPLFFLWSTHCLLNNSFINERQIKPWSIRTQYRTIIFRFLSFLNSVPLFWWFRFIGKHSSLFKINFYFLRHDLLISNIFTKQLIVFINNRSSYRIAHHLWWISIIWMVCRKPGSVFMSHYSLSNMGEIIILEGIKLSIDRVPRAITRLLSWKSRSLWFSR